MRVMIYINYLAMNKMKKIILELKKQSITFTLFLLTFIVIIFLIYLDKENKIDDALNEELKYLDITYKQGLDRFNVISDNIYMSFQNDKKFVNLLVNEKNENIDTVHDSMYLYLKNEFERLKQLEIFGLQIVTQKNISILRMHEPDRYGDDLSNIRFSLKFANEHKTSVQGFEEGKASHAFRSAYPLYKEGEHIGAIEIDFSSTMLQNYSMRVSEIHTHFIVNRNVFKTNAWESKILEPYKQSIEHKDYMFSMSDHIKHPRLEHSRVTLIEPLKKEINAYIKTQKEFAVYKKVDGKIRVVAFLPVKRFKDKKTMAYLVSYTKSNKIQSALDNFKIIVSILTIIFIIIYFIVYKFLVHKRKIENELHYDGLTNIYNRKFLNSHIASITKNLGKGVYLGVAMIDIDFFKKVNDTYGHNVGDTVLKQFTKYIKSTIRFDDFLIRWGGEEFILLINTTSDKTLFKIAEHIRQKIEKSSFDTVGNITCSIGITLYIPGENINQTIQRADEALYKSKENGRNKVSQFKNFKENFVRVVEEKYLKALLDENATIVEFECNILDKGGYSSEDVIGKNWFDIFININDKQKTQNYFRRIISSEDKKIAKFTNDIICKDGTHRFLDFDNTIFTRDGKKFISFVARERFLV